MLKKSSLHLVISIIFIISMKNFAQDAYPHWAEGVVWYQIFPERFANGDPTNDPTVDKVFAGRKEIPKDWKVTKWTSNWFAQSKWEKELGGRFRNHLYERRYGGDIQGIIDRLDYLKKLGVGAIYLNPMFEANSLHKYDASTYHHIDINFGPDPERDKKIIASENPDDPSTWKWTSADSLFLELIKQVHKRGMHIIIDGVFNHTGVDFWAFRDIVKNQQNSKYKDWYIIKSFDNTSTPKNEFDYKGWAGVKSLPEFNRTKYDLNPGPKQYIFNAVRRWMDPNNDGDPSDGIDGWRLDVAREVPMGFWKDWSKLVKSINPNAIIIGELWELSPDFIYKGGTFDALMNYNFAVAVKGLFIDKKTETTVSEFIDELKKIDTTYPEENLNLLMNLMDSHDTDRLSSMIKNPDRKYDSHGDAKNHDYDPGKPGKADYERQKLIAAFQMTYRGAPMIYYGDETGMWGADDPHDRKPMVWGDKKYDDEVITDESGFHKGFGRYKVAVNKNLLNFYREIISIRNDNPPLKKGDLKFLYSNDSLKSFVFSRTYNGEVMIIGFNLGGKLDKVNIAVSGKNISYTELITNAQGDAISSGESSVQIPVNLPPKSFRVYKIYSIK